LTTLSPIWNRLSEVNDSKEAVVYAITNPAAEHISAVLRGIVVGISFYRKITSPENKVKIP
jgi:hypothetical protein